MGVKGHGFESELMKASVVKITVRDLRPRKKGQNREFTHSDK